MDSKSISVLCPKYFLFLFTEPAVLHRTLFIQESNQQTNYAEGKSWYDVSDFRTFRRNYEW